MYSLEADDEREAVYDNLGALIYNPRHGQVNSYKTDAEICSAYNTRSIEVNKGKNLSHSYQAGNNYCEKEPPLLQKMAYPLNTSDLDVIMEDLNDFVNQPISFHMTRVRNKYNTGLNSQRSLSVSFAMDTLDENELIYQRVRSNSLPDTYSNGIYESIENDNKSFYSNKGSTNQHFSHSRNVDGIKRPVDLDDLIKTLQAMDSKPLSNVHKNKLCITNRSLHNRVVHRKGYSPSFTTAMKAIKTLESNNSNVKFNLSESKSTPTDLSILNQNNSDFNLQRNGRHNLLTISQSVNEELMDNVSALPAQQNVCNISSSSVDPLYDNNRQLSVTSGTYKQKENMCNKYYNETVVPDFVHSQSNVYEEIGSQKEVTNITDHIRVGLNSNEVNPIKGSNSFYTSQQKEINERASHQKNVIESYSFEEQRGILKKQTNISCNYPKGNEVSAKTFKDYENGNNLDLHDFDTSIINSQLLNVSVDACSEQKLTGYDGFTNVDRIQHSKNVASDDIEKSVKKNFKKTVTIAVNNDSEITPWNNKNNLSRNENNIKCHENSFRVKNQFRNDNCSSSITHSKNHYHKKHGNNTSKCDGIKAQENMGNNGDKLKKNCNRKRKWSPSGICCIRSEESRVGS